jgi:8-oxo-dGTP pyrophosphatase MutT (NUDIX family)
MSAPFTKLYTLVFCVERVQQSASRILLGMKKRGFGSGKWNGFGGKVEPSDASIEHAACREMAEECSVHVAPDALIKRGLLRFQFRANMAMVRSSSIASV